MSSICEYVNIRVEDEESFVEKVPEWSSESSDDCLDWDIKEELMDEFDIRIEFLFRDLEELQKLINSARNLAKRVMEENESSEEEERAESSDEEKEEDEKTETDTANDVEAEDSEGVDESGYDFLSDSE